jgi:hypothetical protein
MAEDYPVRMRSPLIPLAAITRENRLIATDAAKDAISACGGWIDDFRMFSNKMTSIRFEMPAAQAGLLAETLEHAHVRLDPESHERLQAVAGRDGDVKLTLQITFIHDEPDLRREVLAVPG